MDEGGLNGLREELVSLEAEEARVSAERRHLHRQIDFGFASEKTRACEREVSDRRRELHRQIDALRKVLGLPVGPQRKSLAPDVDRTGGSEAIGELQRIGDDMQRIAGPADHSHNM